VHDGVESVDRVGGVLDGTSGAVRLHQAVAALDDVSAAGFLLSLGVSGQSVLDVVSVAVLGVGVVVGVDCGDFSYGGGAVGKGSSDSGDGGSGVSKGRLSQGRGTISQGGTIRQRGTGRYDGWSADDSGSGNGQ
jgi:hypothetical protein